MPRKKSDYHILVAQNFLANISIDGTHQDTNLRMFLEKGLPKLPSEKKLSRDNKILLKNNKSALSLGTTDSLAEKMNIHDLDDEDIKMHYSLNSSQKDTPSKKGSLFRRIAKIMSSDDANHLTNTSSNRVPILEEPLNNDDMELMEFREGSPSHSHQFNFLKRLKSTITHADRWYICQVSSGVPLAIFSYLSPDSEYIDSASSVFGNTSGPRQKKFRSKSIFESSDRMRHQNQQNSIEELRPFVFANSEDYITLTHVRRRRNPSPFFTLYDTKTHFSFSKKDRKESLQKIEISEDNIVETIEIPQPIGFREASCERGCSLDDKIDEPIDENEPLEDYDPSAFEDIGNLKKTIIRLNGFVGSTLHFVPDERAKTAINENFEEKHPNIQLTMSKMKSIKREMLKLAMLHHFDSYTLAVAYTYFEKIVGMRMISKNNRKCVAGASLLVAMKMNDYSKTIVKVFIERAEDQLREPKAEILAYEMPLCAALKFKLVPPIQEVQPHLDRLQFEMY